jgi:hypothetical protein
VFKINAAFTAPSTGVASVTVARMSRSLGRSPPVGRPHRSQPRFGHWLAVPFSSRGRSGSGSFLRNGQMIGFHHGGRRTERTHLDQRAVVSAEVAFVYFAIWAAYCRGTEDLGTEATVSVAPGSWVRGRRS